MRPATADAAEAIKPSDIHHSGSNTIYNPTAATSSLSHLRPPRLNCKPVEPEDEDGC
jgi:hypothetical protein